MKNKKVEIPQRRLGDTVEIVGNYQWLAVNSRNPVKRFWHLSKKTAIDSLCKPNRNSHVLDVGCGSGVISSFLVTEYDANVIGIDGNSRAIEFAKKQYPEAKFECRLVDDDLKINYKIDNIYCLELIEHIYEPQAENILKNFYRLLKPGGKLYITTPNYKSFWPLIEWLIDAFKLTPNLSNEQHVSHYSPDSLKKLVMRNGFDVKIVTSNCFIAPWIAPFSFRLAEWLGKKELKLKWLVGSIIILVAVKV